MRSGLVMTAIAAVALATSCSQPTPTGAVAGDYRIAGGPSPGLSRPYQGTVWAFTGNLGWEQTQHATPVTHTATDTDGYFRISLAPGHYTLIGAATSLASDGCGAPIEIDIAANATTTAHLVCSIP